MGMYDYLGGEQIKIFYDLIYIKSENGRHEFSKVGGSLKSYDINDELPLKTYFYAYPDNFVVFDFRNEIKDVWVIENKKFKYIKNYEKLNQEELTYPVFNYYGSELNINCLDDYRKITEEFNKSISEYRKRQKEIFPDGINMEVIKAEDYEEKSKLMDKVVKETIESFNQKWYKKEKYILEKTFGAFITNYQYLKDMKDGKVYEWSNPMEKFLNCKKAFQDFLKDNEEILDKYVKWAKNNEIINIEYAKDIIRELNKKTG